MKTPQQNLKPPKSAIRGILLGLFFGAIGWGSLFYTMAYFYAKSAG